MDGELVRALLDAFDRSDWAEMTVTIGEGELHVSRRAEARPPAPRRSRDAAAADDRPTGGQGAQASGVAGAEDARAAGAGHNRQQAGDLAGTGEPRTGSGLPAGGESPAIAASGHPPTPADRHHATGAGEAAAGRGDGNGQSGAGGALSAAGATAGESVESPSVGLFWRAPSPGAPPFVDLDAQVSAGDTLAIVEVMKLMNHVVSPVSGTVKAILAENGATVEYGQSLFIVDVEA